MVTNRLFPVKPILFFWTAGFLVFFLRDFSLQEARLQEWFIPYSNTWTRPLDLSSKQLPVSMAGGFLCVLYKWPLSKPSPLLEVGGFKACSTHATNSYVFVGPELKACPQCSELYAWWMEQRMHVLQLGQMCWLHPSDFGIGSMQLSYSSTFNYSFHFVESLHVAPKYCYYVFHGYQILTMQSSVITPDCKQICLYNLLVTEQKTSENEAHPKTIVYITLYCVWMASHCRLSPSAPSWS